MNRSCIWRSRGQGKQNMNAIETTPSEKPPPKRRWLDVAAWIAITWIVFFLGPLSLAVPVAVCSVSYQLFVARRYLAVGLFNLMTPLGLSAAMAVADYAMGDVHLRYSGLPETTFHNLDPETRCGKATYGCIVDGSEWITQLPYNTTARLLTACFGYTPGAYTGPYPTEEESRSALVHAPVISADELKLNRIVIGGETIQLDDGVGARLLEKLRYFDEWWPLESEEARSIRAIVWKEECVLVRIPVDRRSDDELPSAAIAVFSRTAGRPFAFYGEGRYYHRHPPVSWKRKREP